MTEYYSEQEKEKEKRKKEKNTDMLNMKHNIYLFPNYVICL